LLAGNPSRTDEIVILGLRGKPFSEKGDSGAFVLDTAGNLVALLVGGCSSASQTYVTPIAEVFESIRDLTGCTVKLPEFEDKD